MDKISQTRSIKPTQNNTKFDLGSFKVENFGTLQDDLSEGQGFGSVHSDEKEEQRKRELELEEEKERLEQIIEEQKKQKDMENSDLKDQISTLKSQYVSLQE